MMKGTKMEKLDKVDITLAAITGSLAACLAFFFLRYGMAILLAYGYY